MTPTNQQSPEEVIAADFGIDMDRTYDAAEVRRILGYSRTQTVHSLIRRGELKAVKLSRFWKIKGRWVAELLAANSNLTG